MPNLNRRNFLHMLGAASVAPALPVLPSFGAAAGAATPAQLLWASLNARAGSPAKFVEVARKIGVSPAAARGVHGRLISTRAVAGFTAARTAPVARAVVPSPATTSQPPAKLRHRMFKTDIRKLLVDETGTAVEEDVPDQSHDTGRLPE